MVYKNILTLLIERQDLPHEVMLVAMRALMNGDYTSEQIAAFLVALPLRRHRASFH